MDNNISPSDIIPQKILDEALSKFSGVFSNIGHCEISWNKGNCSLHGNPSASYCSLHYYTIYSKSDGTPIYRLKIYKLSKEELKDFSGKQTFSQYYENEYETFSSIINDCLLTQYAKEKVESETHTYYFSLVKYFPMVLSDLQKLTTNHVKVIMYQLVIALNILHKDNYIHKDIRAENIFLDEKGCAALGGSDCSREIFIWEKQYDCDKFNDNQLFLPCEPPEYTLTGHRDESSDIYQAGIVLYKLLLKSKLKTEKMPPLPYEPFKTINKDNYQDICSKQIFFLGGMSKETKDLYLKYLNDSRIFTEKREEIQQQIIQNLPMAGEKIYITKLKENSSQNEEKNFKLWIQLLEKMLDINPEKRLKSKEFLEDSLFSKYNSKQCEHLKYVKIQGQTKNVKLYGDGSKESTTQGNILGPRTSISSANGGSNKKTNSISSQNNDNINIGNQSYQQYQSLNQSFNFGSANEKEEATTFYSP